MLIENVDTNERVLIVAEIGNNHEGDVDVARRMIGEAAAAGADAVKFQTFRTEQFVRPQDEARFERLKGFELSGDQFASLAAHARREGVLFISTPLDLESAGILEEMVAAFKIASGDNNFMPLLEQVATTNKPLILSSGLSTVERVRCAIATVAQIRNERRAPLNTAVLHCVSAYPVPPEQANLAAIRCLRREFDCPIGYSDHTIGVEAAVLSVAAGARIVEKHFTLDKSYSDFRDHQLSADPREMAELVWRIREAEALLGDESKAPQPCEADAHTALRRSIAAARDLPAGAVLRMSDLVWVRPGSGIPPGRESSLLGRRLRRAVIRGELLAAEETD